ncbi:MAG: PPC domain-containing protein, partial [Pseudomonadota bacterium]
SECGCTELVCTGDETTPGDCVSAAPWEAEPNDLATSAGALAVGVEAAGRLDSVGDADLYALPVSAGVPVRIETLGFCADVVDTALDLIDLDGMTRLAANDDADAATTLSRIDRFVPEASGTYYVRVAGVDSSIGNYRLVVRDLRCQQDPDCGCPDQFCARDGDAPGTCQARSTETEPNNATSSANAIAIAIAGGGRLVGTVETPGDTDFFEVELPAGVYTFETHDYCGSTAIDTQLELFDTDGTTRLAFDDDSGAGRQSLLASVTISTKGVYYLAVTAYGADAGAYVLEVR